MSISHVITRACQDGSQSLSHAETASAGAANNLDESIPDSSTDLVVAFAFAKDKLKSFYITSDKALTVKTYNSVTLKETITLTAGQAIQWSLPDASLLPLPFASDVTSIKVTNASGAAAQLQVRSIVDPT